MSRLRIFSDAAGAWPAAAITDHDEIAAQLNAAGIRFERWEAERPLNDGAPQDEVIDAYRSEIDALMQANGYRSVDVISMTPDHPDKAALRGKFLSEHTHSEDEVRFFVAGQGLFNLHTGGCVYEVLCEQGDLIGVPANTPHWFDMGPNPSFTAIRLFTNPEGWVAQMTGSDIADRFPRLD
ncbi:MAG TPA: acireductone dioxygenase [Gammaproteobacteria bacterium]|jgi:1,2-dihydroxy-3-keto-5-methylthiopentene dioxygenase|nr:acireductone dioxygenase [Gammaproteobacteria bacterium]